MKDLVLIALPDLQLFDPLMYFPLSLLYLASTAQKTGYDVEILDCRTGMEPIPPARFYGFSAMTPHINEAKKVAKTITAGQTIVGGAHPSVLPEELIHDFDYIVTGEGEQVLLDIMAGKHKRGVIAARRLTDLDAIPYPAWDMVPRLFSDTLFPGEKYGKGDMAGTLIASRGCPFFCHFCANTFRAPVIYRSVENIVGELKELIKRGIRHFRFEDDCFTLHPEFKRLCFAIRDLKIHYKSHTRSDLLTPEKAALLKLSGCEECGLGVESADDDVLKKMNKKETAAEHARAIGILKAAGIRAKTYWVMGMPGETGKTLKLNKEFVMETQPDKWTVSTFTPYPGCAVWLDPKAFGVTIINEDYSQWWNFCKAGYNHQLSGQTDRQLWHRYVRFYEWLRSDKWRSKT